MPAADPQPAASATGASAQNMHMHVDGFWIGCFLCCRRDRWIHKMCGDDTLPGASRTIFHTNFLQKLYGILATELLVDLS